jgi:hypothetical protein
LLVIVLGANGGIAMRRPPRTSMSTADNLVNTKASEGNPCPSGQEKVSERMLSNSSTRSREQDDSQNALQLIEVVVPR